MDLKTEITRFCHKYLLRLNKDLGQHYLIDEFVLDAILEAANITKNDTIVEIGPGIGVLTRELIKEAKQVIAIEFDDRIIPLLETFLGDPPPENLTIIQGNALNVPMPEEPYSMVANIPYHITSPLLRHVFLESKQIPKSMTLLIQKEVAEKICDKKDAGILTILVGLFGKASIICDVPPACFLPPPKVDSAVIHIDCYEKPIADTEIIEHIFTLTKVAFSQKRKMLRNTFGTFPGGLDLLAAADIDVTRRPQTLSIEEWVKIGEEAIKC